MEPEDHSLWVFGYGSLCWNPGFKFGDSVVGHIEGFSRKFWQGNTTHRGTEEKVYVRNFKVTFDTHIIVEALNFKTVEGFLFYSCLTTLSSLLDIDYEGEKEGGRI